MLAPGRTSLSAKRASQVLFMAIIGYAYTLRAAGLDEIEAASTRARDAVAAATGRISLLRTSKRDPETLNTSIEKLLARPGASAALRAHVEREKWRSPAEAQSHEEIQYVFDPTTGRLRAEVRDLRDLNAIMGPGKTAKDRADIALMSRTGVHVLDRRPTGGFFWGQRQDAARALTLEFMGSRAGTTLDPPLSAGIPSPDCLSALRLNTKSVDRVREGGRELVRVCSVASETPTQYRATFDPSMGHRLRLYEVRDPQGRLMEKVMADDYRAISGIPYPFLQTEEQWDPSSGRCLSTTVTRITSAEFNIPLTEADFALETPEGTSVFIVLSDHRMVRQKTERSQIMGLPELEGMVLAVEQAAQNMGRDANSDVLTAVAIEQWASFASGRRLSPLTRPAPKTIRIELPGTRPSSQPAEDHHAASQPRPGAAP